MAVIPFTLCMRTMEEQDTSGKEKELNTSDTTILFYNLLRSECQRFDEEWIRFVSDHEWRCRDLC